MSVPMKWPWFRWSTTGHRGSTLSTTGDPRPESLFPLKLDNEYKMYEYACHEGNTAIRNYIETSRFERAQKK